MKKELIVPFTSPLNKNDTENQTQGCRHTNPDICGSNSITNICAFASSDEICKRPSRAWKKKYLELIKMEKDVDKTR